MTTAKTVLDKNLSRTRSFTRIFFAGSTKPQAGQKRGPGQPSLEAKELLRAAIVFSIGTLDAYLPEVAAEVLLSQLRTAQASPSSGARQLLRRVLKEVDTLAIELALASSESDRHEIARRALLEHLTSNVPTTEPREYRQPWKEWVQIQRKYGVLLTLSTRDGQVSRPRASRPTDPRLLD